MAASLRAFVIHVSAAFTAEATSALAFDALLADALAPRSAWTNAASPSSTVYGTVELPVASPSRLPASAALSSAMAPSTART